MTVAAANEETGFLRIRGEDVPVRTVWIDQSKLRFFVDNPRIYSIVRAGDRQPEQEDICRELLELEHVRELKEDIKINGGLIDPLIVREGTLEVLEGNSRLAAYRWLFLNDEAPSLWAKVKCTVLPADIDERLVYALLGQYHIKGKKDWQPFEQAGFLYRRFKNQKQDTQTLAKEFGLRLATAENMVQAYKFMLDHGEADPDRWSYYFEYLKAGKKVQNARTQYPDFDTLIVSKIRSGEINRAVDVRDKLPMVCNEPRFLKRFYEGKITFTEAVERAEDAGGDNADLQKIKKFSKWLAAPDTDDDLVDNEKNIRDKIEYELSQIEKRISKIKTKLEKKKLKEEQALARKLG